MGAEKEEMKRMRGERRECRGGEEKEIGGRIFSPLLAHGRMREKREEREVEEEKMEKKIFLLPPSPYACTHVHTEEQEGGTRVGESFLPLTNACKETREREGVLLVPCLATEEISIVRRCQEREKVGERGER